MNAFIILTLSLAMIACGSQQAKQLPENSNTAEAPQRAEKLQSTIAHTSENAPAPLPTQENAPAGNSRWSQGGDPIDTEKFDEKIAAAEKSLKAKPDDDAAKKEAAQAYFERGFALTEARQYASALGDYRRALKLDPGHEDSKKWIDQIVGIYSMMKKEYPKEGEEPPPLPFKKA